MPIHFTYVYLCNCVNIQVMFLIVMVSFHYHAVIPEVFHSLLILTKNKLVKHVSGYLSDT